MEVSRAKMNKQSIYCVVLDVEKAFDSVERHNLIEALERIELSKEFIDVVEGIYKEVINVVFKDGVELGHFNRHRGIKRGCKLSPTLFNICLDKVVKRVNKMFPYERTNLLLYADDCLVLAKNENNMRTKIRLIKEGLEGIGLKINEEKSGAIVFGEHDGDEVAGIKNNNG